MLQDAGRFGPVPASRLSPLMRGLPLVRERRKFLRNELRATGATVRYSLTGSGLAVHLRHRIGEGSGDIDALHAAFARRVFSPPAEVQAHLDDCVAPRVVDLSARIGLFALCMAECYPTVRATVCEDDVMAAMALRRTITVNGFRGWKILGRLPDDELGSLLGSADVVKFEASGSLPAVFGSCSLSGSGFLAVVFRSVKDAASGRAELEGLGYTVLDDQGSRKVVWSRLR